MVKLPVCEAPHHISKNKSLLKGANLLKCRAAKISTSIVYSLFVNFKVITQLSAFFDF